MTRTTSGPDLPGAGLQPRDVSGREAGPPCPPGPPWPPGKGAVSLGSAPDNNKYYWKKEFIKFGCLSLTLVSPCRALLWHQISNSSLNACQDHFRALTHIVILRPFPPKVKLNFIIFWHFWVILLKSLSKNYYNPLFALYPFSGIVCLRLLLHINVELVCRLHKTERGRICSSISLLFLMNK